MVREGSQPKDGRNGDQPIRSVRLGTLYVVSTPIGNPDDITIRAIRTLKTVSLIASEDPSATQALLAHHHISGTITSYGPRNLEEKVALLLNRLKKGHDVALVSDCGTPVICDPGRRLIEAAHHAKIPVRSVPGPSALTAAISVSGCSGDDLLFEGHLPRPARTLETFLSALRSERRTLVFFVASRDVKTTLSAMAKIFPARRVTLAQNLTKSGELTLRGTADMLLKKLWRGKKGAAVTVVIEGAPQSVSSSHDAENSALLSRRHSSG